ncbi:hypothetical protein [Desulfoplanes sp.]
MKTQVRTIIMLLALLVPGSAAYAQNNADQHAKVYQIETRLDEYTRPTTFTPTQAIPVNGALSEHVVTTTQRLLNKEAPFLKKGLARPVGEDRLSAWEFVSDEGGAAHDQTAPNPLSYFAAGISSSLLTQIERGIRILDLDVEDVKVESRIIFRWADTMTEKWSGYTDKVTTNIIIKSDESAEKIRTLKELALKAWAVGEGLAQKTTIDAAVVINADNWAGLTPRPGKVESPVSMDNGFKLTDVTPDLHLQTIPFEEDLSVDMHNLPNPMVFSEISIAESAHDAARPYMHRIRAKSLTENYATWDLYADDSRGYEGTDKAPTSWDYFTIGTSFCLMSQLTANHAYFQKQGVDIDDFRVEHQFDYQKDNFMTPTMTGHLDNVITRVVVTGDAAKEALEGFARQSLRTCFAGEGIQNETEMESNVYLNGKIVE